MNYSMQLENSKNGKKYDISTLCNNIKYDATLFDQPSSLTFMLEKDPNDILEVANGSKVIFKADDVGIFYGYVFNMETDATERYKITAYDQTRYFKNPEVTVTKDQTASQIFETVCKYDPNINYEIKYPTKVILPARIHDNISRYDMIRYAIDRHLYLSGEQCFIRDDFGTIIWDELENQKTDIILGDNSLVTSYQYSISIDNDTYNMVEIVHEDEESRQRYKWQTEQQESQNWWGTLKHLIKIDQALPEDQLKEMAAKVLQLKDRETKTMRLSAIGNPNFRPGTGFILKLDKLGIEEYMWITDISHTFAFDLHLMEMTVKI